MSPSRMRYATRWGVPVTTRSRVPDPVYNGFDRHSPRLTENAITRTPGRTGRGKAVTFDGTMTCVAAAPETTSSSMETQSEQALAVIDACLADAGTNKSRVLNATVYLADMSRWNEIRPSVMSMVKA